MPAHLKTAAQLKDDGRRPGGPTRGCVARSAAGAWLWLYDETEAVARRAASPAQRAALARGRATQDARRRTCALCGAVVASAQSLGEGGWCAACLAARDLGEQEARREMATAARAAAAVWAAKLLAGERWCVLDIETTGLGGDAAPVQVAVVAPDGAALLDTLVAPTVPVEPEAAAIHGLTAEALAGATPFAAVYPALAAAVAGQVVVAYNAAFDRAILDRACATAGVAPLAADGWSCAMERYAAFIGDWSEGHGDFRWHPQPGGDHHALGDARATLALVRAMATSHAANA